MQRGGLEIHLLNGNGVLIFFVLLNSLGAGRP